jgi:acyl-CoA thioester hydrolase
MARHTYLCPVRWFDLDAYQHVNNVQFLRFLEEARVDFLFTLAPREGAKTLKEGVLIARHEIDYKRPLPYRSEPVQIDTWVTQIRAAAFTLSYEVRDADGPPPAPGGVPASGVASSASGGAAAGGAAVPRTVYARASSVLVPYDFTEERPRRITAEERGYLETFLEDR